MAILRSNNDKLKGTFLVSKIFLLYLIDQHQVAGLSQIIERLWLFLKCSITFITNKALFIAFRIPDKTMLVSLNSIHGKTIPIKKGKAWQQAVPQQRSKVPPLALHSGGQFQLIVPRCLTTVGTGVIIHTAPEIQNSISNNIKIQDFKNNQENIGVTLFLTSTAIFFH